MDYLRVTKNLKVRTRDILYIRKVRESEGLSLDRDGAIKAPVGAAIIVFKAANSARIVTPIAFSTLKERMAFVDIGENRFVPASNIEAIEQSADEGVGQRFCSVWLFGGSVLTTLIPFYILEGRHREGAYAQLRMDERAANAERVKQKLLERPKFAPVIPAYPFPYSGNGCGLAA